MVCMKKIKWCAVACCLFVCTLLVTACEDAPEHSQKSEDDNVISLSTEQYVTIEEAKKQMQELAGKTVLGFELPEQIQVPDVVDIFKVSLYKWYPDREKELKNAVKNLWQDYGKVDWTKKKEKRFSNKIYDAYYGAEKQDKKSGLVYSYDSDGFLCGDSLNDTELTSEDCVKEFDLEWGDTVPEEEMYPLAGGETTVAEAIAFTEDLLEKHLSELEQNQFEYKVQHVYVMKNKDTGFYDYNMVIGRIYEGVPIDTSSDFIVSEGKSYYKTHCGAHIIAIMRNKNSLDYISTSRELFEIDSVAEKEKIIAPKWALQKMNEEIAHDTDIRFTECGLVYLLVQDNRLSVVDKQDVYQQVDETTYLRPVWLFTQEGNGGAAGNLTKDSHGISVIVDALDTNLYYYESTSAY